MDQSITQQRILKLIDDTFTDPQVKDVALYIMASLAVGESISMGMAKGGGSNAEGIPAFALDTVYRYDANLVDNEFYFKHYMAIKAHISMDRLKQSAFRDLLTTGESKGSTRCFEAAKELLQSKMVSLAYIAMLWKGYEAGKEFLCQLQLISEPSPEVREYFRGKGVI